MPNELYEVVGQLQTTRYDGRERATEGVEITARLRATGDTFVEFVPMSEYTPESVGERLAARAITTAEIASL